MLLRLVLYALLVLLLSRALRLLFGGVAQGLGAAPRHQRGVERGVKMARDPVCGTFVLPASAFAVRDGDGTHHFCSEKCRQAYLARARR